MNFLLKKLASLNFFKAFLLIQNDVYLNLEERFKGYSKNQDCIEEINDHCTRDK